MSIVPGQVVYLPFTLSETPDSLPTVAGYKRGAEGTFAAQSGMSPTVVNVSGLAYYASAIIPDDAEPGDGYTLMVSVTVGGESSVYWLDGGVVGYPGLLPDEREKVMLIGTDGALAEIVRPIADGGTMTLWTGIDYETGAYGPITNDLPAAAQSRAPDVGGAIYFQIRRKSNDLSRVFDVPGTIVDSAENPGTKAVNIPIPKSVLATVDRFDDQWMYFVGDRPTGKQDAFIVGNLTMCPGPIPPT